MMWAWSCLRWLSLDTLNAMLPNCDMSYTNIAYCLFVKSKEFNILTRESPHNYEGHGTISK